MKRVTLTIEGKDGTESYTADDVADLWVSKWFANVDHYSVSPVEALCAVFMAAHDTDGLDDAMYQVMANRPDPSGEVA